MRTTTITLAPRFPEDQPLVDHEIKAIERWNWLVKSVDGVMTEVDSTIRIDFHNGDHITEKYTFKPFGSDPEHISGKVNTMPFVRHDMTFNEEYLGNYDSLVVSLIHYYLDHALRLTIR